MSHPLITCPCCGEWTTFENCPSCGRKLRVAVSLIVLALLSGCALIAPIDSRMPVQRYKAAEYSWQALNAVDMLQTLHIAKAERTADQMAAQQDAGFIPNRYCYEEGDPLTKMMTGKQPSQRNVVLSSVAYALIHYGVSAWLEKMDRVREDGTHYTPWVLAARGWHAIGLGWKGATVYNNWNIGLRIGGSGCRQ